MSDNTWSQVENTMCFYDLLHVNESTTVYGKMCY